MRKIGLWGVVRVGPNDGYGYAGYKMVQTLNSLNVQTTWQDENAPVALNFLQPELYEGLPSQHRIAYTPWESTELPKGWATIINQQDEFWTTSHFCKEVFEAGGVKLPIRVVPHGLDASEWPLTKRVKSSPFIFLHQGEPAERKGSQLVFDAFKKVFKNIPDANLVFKSSAGWVEARWYDNNESSNPPSILGPVDSWPNVHIIRGILTQPELNELLQKAHCLVYPSSGEGFGLIPFQSAGTGMPTIVPNWGGITEFGHHLIEMDYKVSPSNHGYHLGEWAWPDFDSLCSLMLDVYENYETHASRAYVEAEKLREEFSWEKIFTPVVSDLQRFF